LHTAVALELSAGKAQAAGLTRKPARLTSPPTRRHLHPEHPSQGRVGGAKPGRGHRLMPGRWPGDHLRVSRHSARPAGRTGKSNRASNLKSQPVAFGISRPTRTTRTTEELTPQLRGGKAADRGLDCSTQSPGNGRRQPAVQDPTYARRHSTVPEARHTADSAGELQPGRRGDPRPGRWPGDHLRVSWHSARLARAENGAGTAWLDARLSRPPPAAVGVVTRAQPLPTTGPCQPHTPTDSDGTCHPRAGALHADSPTTLRQ
jgi:hypothetical protein